MQTPLSIGKYAKSFVGEGKRGSGLLRPVIFVVKKDQVVGEWQGPAV